MLLFGVPEQLVVVMSFSRMKKSLLNVKLGLSLQEQKNISRSQSELLEVLTQDFFSLSVVLCDHVVCLDEAGLFCNT